MDIRFHRPGDFHISDNISHETDELDRIPGKNDLRNGFVWKLIMADIVLGIIARFIAPFVAK